MPSGSYLSSPNGRWLMAMQADGNLVLYSSTSAMNQNQWTYWVSATSEAGSQLSLTVGGPHQGVRGDAMPVACHASGRGSIPFTFVATREGLIENSIPSNLRGAEAKHEFINGNK